MSLPPTATTPFIECRNGALQGQYAPRFAPLAQRFAQSLERGEEIGASLCVYHRGEKVVDLWGGLADTATRTPWTADSLIVVFSATKGLTAMALNLAAQRGAFEWDAPVAQYWPAFAQAGKAHITVRQLFNHRAGLAGIHTPLTLKQLCDPTYARVVRAALETQAPAWTADADQGYHGISYGLYASAFFEQVCHEPLSTFLHREYLDPLGADVFLGTPAEQDERVATLYPHSTLNHLGKMAWSALRGGSTESNVSRSFLRGSHARQAFMNPPTPGGIGVYNQLPVRRHNLAWASATATARGLARAYVPWSMGGQWQGQRYVAPRPLRPLSSAKAGASKIWCWANPWAGRRAF